MTVQPSQQTQNLGIKGRDILCFSNDWSGDPLSKTHLMRLLARDNRILWVNSIGYRAPTVSKADISRAFKKLAAATSPITEPEPNIFVFNPLAIPAYGRPQVRDLNKRLLRYQVKRAMRKLGFSKPINWVFLPSAAVVAGTLNEDFLIYHCVDEYTAFSGVSSQFQSELEEQLLRRADLVVVSSDLLFQSKVKHNSNTVLVRHGVDHAHFSRALEPATPVPAIISALPKPVIGFFGLVADWVDIELIAKVAERFREGSLVILGKVTTDVSLLEQMPNVHLLGRKHYSELPAYCKGFDVALMPFRINELTLNSNPLKVREYLAAGLPVVSTAIPEVEVLGLCAIGRDHDSFIRAVETALLIPGPTKERSDSIRSHSWEARLAEIARHIPNFHGPQTVGDGSSDTFI
jgi:glycosyltransferase involved in cell wall biosynthesis